MELTASLFADIDTSYRHERISRSFRDRSAARHRHLLRRNRHPAGEHVSHRTLRAA